MTIDKNPPVATGTAPSSSVLLAMLTALAGGLPAEQFTKTERAYQLREQLKAQASKGVRSHPEPMHASHRAPYWVLWAYSHWCRTQPTLDDLMSAEELETTFPDGMTFGRYLGAWLWSVGVPCLSMTTADLEAVQQMTGIAPLPHPNLPHGMSELRLDYFRTTSVDKVPARDLTEIVVRLAFSKDARSRNA